MNILSSRILFAGLLMLGLSATLLMQPAQSFLTAQQSAPQTSKTSGLPFQGVWVGTYRFVGGDGQVQMYVNPAGDLFGSFASNDGFQFAQISGKHRGNAFHIVFTPPSGMSNQPSGSISKVVDATAKWENGSDRFSVAGEAVGHPYSYTFKRLKQN